MNTALHPAIGQPWPAAAPSRRRLGEIHAKPRRLYFLDFPLLLLSVGLLTWIMPTDTMLLVSSFTGAVTGLYTLWEIAIRRKPIRFSHIICVAHAGGYGVGALNSWLTVPRGSLKLAEFFNKDPEAVSHAMAAVLIACGVLYALGELYETPVFGDNFRLPVDNRALLFSVCGTALIITAYFTGHLGYMGGSVSDTGHVSVFMGLVGWLFPALFAMTCVFFLDWRKSVTKRFLGLLIFVQFMLTIPIGRRNIVYFTILAVIASRLASFRFRWSAGKKLLFGVVLASVIALGTTVFFYLRYAALGKRHISLPDRISLAWSFYSSGNTAKATQDLQHNLQTRTFVLGYLSDLLDASLRMPAAGGQNAWHEFQLIVPSALWPGKEKYLYPEEMVANMTFNFSYKDEANSIYSAGALDFGIWGMILYPIAISALFRIVAEIIRVSLPEIVATIATLALIFNALMTEAGLWVRFLALRDALLFTGLLWVFFRIPAFSLRNSQSSEARS